jgi:hypothetical protein
MSGEQLQNVFEILDSVHPSATWSRRLALGGLDPGDVSIDGDQRGKTLVRRPPLPEIEVPRLGVGRRARPVRLYCLSASPASFFKVYHNQYFSIARL